MAAMTGYYDTLKSVAGKVLTYLSTITLTGTDGKTITCTQDTSLDEAVAMSSKAPKASPSFTGIVTTEGQIAFPAVANPSANTNTLDDYEEGTWTPGLSFAGASVGITYTGSTAGAYTKIGNMVFIDGIVALSSKGSSVGQARITGLPFTVSAYLSVPCLQLNNNVTFANQFMGQIEDVGTTVLLYEVTEAGARTGLTDADFADNSTVYITAAYRI